MAAPARVRLLQSNLRRFVIFRVFFNARFYYPVFTILFLDYGLTLEQFSILNLVWALTIVLAEVPSGALADLLGKKRLIVFAAFLMLIEMAVLVFVPIGASPLLFIAFIVNRICSGLAEAAASGADEALAYDSLVELDREDEWSGLLEKTTRYMSLAFFINMIVGAFSYDHKLVNQLIQAMHPDWELSRELVMRFPVILTMMTSCIVLITAIGLREVQGMEDSTQKVKTSLAQTVGNSFSQILQAASWTFNHRFVLFVILAALALDSVARQFVILASEYYRIIHIPTAWFGFIGAGMSLVGLVNARISRYLVTHHSPFFNLMVLSTILMTGLIGIMFTIPWFGIFFAICAFSMMGMVGYQSSFYLNRQADSKNRATVLSFRGLALNLGLGFASLLYTGLIAAIKQAQSSVVSASDIQAVAFVQSLKAFPVYFALVLLAVLVSGKLFLRNQGICFKVPEGASRSAGSPPPGPLD